MSSVPATTPRARRGRILARAALLLGLACAAAALLAGPAYRTEAISLASSLQTLRWAVTAAVVGVAASLLAVAMLIGPGQRRGIAIATIALVVNALVIVPPLVFYRVAAKLPAIHDISTDTTDPPRFVDILPLRSAAPNGVDYPPQTASLQREAYPDIDSFMLTTSPQKSFDRAARAAASMGWEIVTIAPAELRIEATATTFYFGFKDDVVVRVSAAETGSRIDVRSTSRVGRHDFGTNAKRIRAYIEKLKRS